VSLTARFVAAPTVPPLTYTYSLHEFGLPSGVTWGFALSGSSSGAAGATSTLTASDLNGSYALTVPYVYLNSGIRYVPSLAVNTPVTVVYNVSGAVTFSEQVLVTVSTSGNGSASGGGWFAADTQVPISAAAAPAGWVFAGWEGSGVGSYTGTNTSESLYPTGPVTETATYVPATTTSTSSTNGVTMTDWLVIGLVIVILAAVGIAEGATLARRRRPPARPTLPSGQVEGEVVAPALPPKSS
jgi:hypothetical protein